MADLALFSEHRHLIEEVIRTVIRRRRIGRDEAEDFASVARLNLLEDRCAVIRRFRGESSLGTYLIRVLDRMLLDYRVETWGKWRASARAKRQGPLAVHLERLTSRDGLTFNEAAETLRTNFQVARTDAELWALYCHLPRRTPRLFQADDVLHAIPATGNAPDEGLRTHSARMIAALQRALATLDPEDRLLLHQRFFGGIKPVRIARSRGIDQKRLYARFARILVRLRAHLEAAGVEASTFREWMDHHASDVSSHSIAAFPQGERAPWQASPSGSQIRAADASRARCGSANHDL